MFKLLLTFKMVYETKNFSQAAELLFIAQPTVSTQIRQLEEELQTTLFIRHGRTTLLVTPQAEELYRRATKLLDDWAATKNELQQTQRQQQCRIAASHTFANHFLPQLLPLLYQQQKQIDFSVTMVNSLAVFEALQQHKIDLGFIEKPLSSPDVCRQTLFHDQLGVVNQDCPEQPWLVREPDSGVFHYTARYFAEHDLQETQLTIANNDLIVALLHQGFGKAIISQSAAAGLPFRSLGASYQRQFYLITRQDQSQQRLAAVIKQIEQWATTQRHK
ncbi:LysR family transcriptional regulator [Lapidilactobacillus gannanensis]|uniref:LysR family transcriptional regulator n=1 Tax=Lapidilactobacillus gannanensis TaxID=2486002 RepID=A0ABW4BMN4_9LACO|nr:LysR family transcriptional regulator [Lapidilactobacillus gannanensis]